MIIKANFFRSIDALENELNRRVKTAGPFEAAAKIIARFQILIHLL